MISGQLPCLLHGQRSVSGLSAIVKFVEHLDSVSSSDASLTPVEKAQAVARIAQIESDLGDLAVCTSSQF